MSTEDELDLLRRKLQSVKEKKLEVRQKQGHRSWIGGGSVLQFCETSQGFCFSARFRHEPIHRCELAGIEVWSLHNLCLVPYRPSSTTQVKERLESVRGRGRGAFNRLSGLAPRGEDHYPRPPPREDFGPANERRERFGGPPRPYRNPFGDHDDRVMPMGRGGYGRGRGRR